MALTKIAAKPNSKKVNKNIYYININKMTYLKNDMEKQLEIVLRTFMNMYGLTENSLTSNTFSDSFSRQMERVSEKIRKQAENSYCHSHDLKNVIESEIEYQKMEILYKNLQKLQEIVAHLKNY